MQAEQSILDRIQRTHLKCCGNLLRIEDRRWPKKIFQWTPYGRRTERPLQTYYDRKWTSSAFGNG